MTNAKNPAKCGAIQSTAIICHGNILRSQALEHYVRHYAGLEHLELQLFSAGIAPREAYGNSELLLQEVDQELQRRGIRRQVRRKPWSDDAAAWVAAADAVLAADSGIKAELITKMGDRLDREKLFTFYEFIGEGEKSFTDTYDPATKRQDPRRFASAFDELARIARKIVKLAGLGNTLNVHRTALGGAAILQLAPTIDLPVSSMMSYIITTPHSKLIIIDGGHDVDAGKLRCAILERGGHVDLWLLTHPHWDHIDALTRILNSPRGVTIGTIVYDFPPLEWLSAAESDPVHVRSNTEFYAAISQYPGLRAKPRAGTSFSLDGVKIDVLCDPHEYKTVEYFKYINNLGIAFRITFPNGVSALFLGDLGPHAAIGLTAEYGAALKSDIVQMAHHGFHGAYHGNHTAMRDLYRLCAPGICLWPTTDWLWTNLDGAGPYTTLETRQWMDELGVRANLVSFAGDWLLI